MQRNKDESTLTIEVSNVKKSSKCNVHIQIIEDGVLKKIDYERVETTTNANKIG